MPKPDQHKSHPPTQPGESTTTSNQPRNDETYQTIADTVGGVPSLRRKDNLYQGLFILASLVIGVGIGGLVGGKPGLFVGGFIGLLAGLLSSGVLLLVLGWIRVLQRKKDPGP